MATTTDLELPSTSTFNGGPVENPFVQRITPPEIPRRRRGRPKKRLSKNTTPNLTNPSGKRKRGPKRKRDKITLLKKRPEREKKRVEKPEIILEERKIPKENKHPWSKKEKHALLIAVKRHGHTNMQELRKAVPTKSESQIAYYLRARERDGQRLRLKKLKGLEERSPLDGWEDWVREVMHLRRDYSVVLARVLQLISQHENVTASDKSLKEIYEYLEKLMTRDTVRSLSEINDKIVAGLFDMLMNILEEIFSDMTEETVCLGNWSEPRVDESGMSKDKAESDLRISLNPLDIPVEVLKNTFDKIKSHPAYERQIEKFVDKCIGLCRREVQKEKRKENNGKPRQEVIIEFARRAEPESIPETESVRQEDCVEERMSAEFVQDKDHGQANTDQEESVEAIQRELRL